MLKMTVYTRCPVDADYSQSKTVETFLHGDFNDKPKEWRKVEIVEDAYRVKYQLMRYCSFLGGAPIIDDPRKVSIYDRRPALLNDGSLNLKE